MTEEKLAALIERKLALEHKLKVHQASKDPTAHKAIAAVMIDRWRFEDELAAVTKLINDYRNAQMEEFLSSHSEKLH